MNILEGKTALITGGGTGIGLGIAKRFYKEGAEILICGRREMLLQKAVQEISPDGSKVAYEVSDLTIEQDIKDLTRAAVRKLGKLDILVNCAGIMRYGKLDEIDRNDWDLQMKINLYAPWRLMKEVAPHMRENKGGSIVNISSIAGNKAYPSAGVYCATKAALQMLSQVMAMELAEDNIRINIICPAMVENTELVNPMISPEDIPAFYAKIKPLHPLGRNGNPGDIASSALFLASDESSWITGAILPVDGGRHMATNRPEVK
ncbi:MAG TPA: SDR family oxidoreductase [bacterium]|nr:SDR family oxidoreductase [bacterium]